MFKWGIIGLGRIAHKFAQELHETGIGKVVAVASRDINKAILFANEFGIEKSYGSYEEFASSALVDAIYIAVPHHLHFKTTMMCLKAGKPVLCEKPFTINRTQLFELIEYSRSNNIFLMEAMWTRFMPHIVYLKQIVQDRRLGKILHLKAEFCFKGKERGIQLGLNRLLENELGGGALLDIGIYPLFLALLLLGNPDSILASSSIVNEIDESTMAILKYKDGSTAYLESSILWESQGLAVIYFEKGTVTIPKRWHEHNELIIKNEQGHTQTEKWTYPSRGFYYEMKEAQDCILAGKVESDLMPHQFSLDMMDTLDKIRNIIGLSYPADRE